MMMTRTLAAVLLAGQVSALGQLSCSSWVNVAANTTVNGTAMVDMAGKPTGSNVDVSVYQRNADGSWGGWMPCGAVVTPVVMTGLLHSGKCNATMAGPVWTSNNMNAMANNTLEFDFSCATQPEFKASGNAGGAVPTGKDAYSIVLTNMMANGASIACCDLVAMEPTLPPVTMPPAPPQTVTFTGLVDLNAGDMTNNSHVAGSIVGVLCGFTTLVIAMFGYIEK